MSSKEKEQNLNKKKKNSEIEFYTPKSNLSIGSVNRNVAINNLYKYVNKAKKVSNNKIKKRFNGRNNYITIDQSNIKLSNIFGLKEKNKKPEINKDKFLIEFDKSGTVSDKNYVPINNNIKTKVHAIKKSDKQLNNKKGIFFEHTENILRYFKNVDSTKSANNTQESNYEQNKHDIEISKTCKDQNNVINNNTVNNIYSKDDEKAKIENINNKETIRDINNNNQISYLDKVWDNSKITNCENCENSNILNFEKDKIKNEHLQNDKHNDVYYAYLETMYIYSRKYLLYNKMEFISKILFCKQPNLKNFIYLIESLFLKKKYVKLLNLLRIHKKLWVFPCPKKDTQKSYNKKKVGHNKHNNDIHQIFMHSNSPIHKIYDCINTINISDDSYINATDEKQFLCKNFQRVKKKKSDYEHKNKESKQIKLIKNKKYFQKIKCINYIAYIKIKSLLKIKNKNCLNKGVRFINKLNKKKLIKNNCYYLLQVIIDLYELKGLYNHSLKYSILLFLKCPIYPQMILKLFGLSLLSLKDEIYLILLAKCSKKVKWLKYFLLFILYSVKYQFHNSKVFYHFLFLIESVTKAKHKNKCKNSCRMSGNAINYDNKLNKINISNANGYRNGHRVIENHSFINTYNNNIKTILEKDCSNDTESNQIDNSYILSNTIQELRQCREYIEQNKFEKNMSDFEKKDFEVSNIFNGTDMFHTKNYSNILIFKKVILYNSIYNKITLYDIYIYLTKNIFSKYFPRVFLYSKIYIIINIKRSFYERNYSMCYSLCKLLLMDQIYDSCVITFFVNSAYLLNKISCIKKLAKELKKINKYIYFLFCNASLLLYFNKIERSIQIYKYIIDTYSNIFSDLYFYSLSNLIYSLQLTQKAHQIIVHCKNLNKLFFNNIHSYILLSYYYFVNNIPNKTFNSLFKAYRIYNYHPDIYYILSMLSLSYKKFKDYVSFSELALFFSLRKQVVRNYIFTKIYDKQNKYIPSYLLHYNFKIINTNEISSNTFAFFDEFMCYFYFENLIKAYVILHFVHSKRCKLNYLILGENLCTTGLKFFSKDIKLLHILGYIYNIKKRTKVLLSIDDVA
ncbi:conserved Plasmodium protein, unknown function [Plasmodium berghei]|uniref:Uncharacterized protein n=2 Tax=Plasmodium berghei TaxID=5821 RepID=A0A509ARV3_PLABA|nr:conserved Plasmodium protein, unknown function [Plasmodium berghei ANKA]CXJ18431.1 conserved Plasmodium protein, unknown function [Plasmodium berghei]SCM26429.1 conserved Plasmodium protein, unknown function [Plasmodium berghei]SCN28451.1 conserved Plasmodium protein, unknown function [Plasmodium berghei]SCO62644.1 conserved Plasmodium protein, unknown function [Plasmodium berghei]SCO64205.1 conserved Plasmodium protein, unknown function [Plasmodium berghei]|eukprot:XP_034424099.1 conserved Plasmodium protein, unknown function [Plasmodium berghei ANKA]